MSKFFKNLFSGHSTSSERKKNQKTKQDIPTQSDSSISSDIEEFSVPNYDTRRKMSTSRSGRMKHNQKVRGTLRKDLYGEVRFDENTSREYHVHGKSFTQEFFQQPSTSNDEIKKSLENIYNLARQESNQLDHGSNSTSKDRSKRESENINMDQEIENMFKPVLIETTF